MSKDSLDVLKGSRLSPDVHSHLLSQAESLRVSSSIPVIEAPHVDPTLVQFLSKVFPVRPVDPSDPSSLIHHNAGIQKVIAYLRELSEEQSSS